MLGTTGPRIYLREEYPAVVIFSSASVGDARFVKTGAWDSLV
jgi:hypothetical protein